MGEHDSARRRLEQQAAEILGKARANASEVLRFAQAEADGLLHRAQEHAEQARLEATDASELARREVEEAQKKALAIRSEAQRIADGIIRRATQRARTEADALLKDARLQLARAVQELTAAQAAATAIRDDAIVIDLREPEPVLDITDRIRLAAVADSGPEPEVIVPAVPTPPITPAALREWVSDLSDDTLDTLIGTAVASAVERAIRPTVVRAGRYTFLKPAV